jgi:hypothetical protein
MKCMKYGEKRHRQRNIKERRQEMRIERKTN